MDDKYGPLLFEEDLSPEQRAALQERFDENPELAEEWARWREVRRQLRRRMQGNLPDRRLLVLYALEQEGRDDLLTSKEKAALDAARGDITEAFEALPALEQVVEYIQAECADFDTVWDQYLGEEASEATPAPRQSTSKRRDRAPRRPSRSQDLQSRRWAWRLTVAVLLLGAAVLAVFYGPQNTSSRTTVAVAADEQRVIEFDDGTTARLVGAATLSYVSDGSVAEQRSVRLEHGQAYFDVADREEVSFAVNTPTATATVLGTQFGVTTRADTTKVVLVEGRVRVGSVDGGEKDTVVLSPGQRSVIQRGEAPTVPAPVNLTDALAWSGLFVFRSVPTKTIAQRLSRHYDVSIAVAPALADEPVTGTFEQNQSVSEVLHVLARTLGAEVSTQEDTYRLQPAS